MSDMEMLFSPCRIGNLVIKNRAVLPLVPAMNHYKWNRAGTIALGLILPVWGIDRFPSLLRRKIA